MNQKLWKRFRRPDSKLKKYSRCLKASLKHAIGHPDEAPIDGAYVFRVHSKGSNGLSM